MGAWRWGVLVVVAVAACGAPKSDGFGPAAGSMAAETGNGSGGSRGVGGGAASNGFGDAAEPSGSAQGTSDPTTCAEAATSYSYVGCDYWPTPLTNTVWSVFDFAVAVSNGQLQDATVDVTGPGGFSQQAVVPAGQLTKIYLPWNTALKGPDWDSCTDTTPWGQSIVAPGGAFHLTSSIPVTVYQFNALEYAPQGGPQGKDWSACPGNQTCAQGGTYGCYSFSNDASLLLPSTAMTGNYRLMGAVSAVGGGSYVGVTGTQNGTTVTVTLSQTATVAPGGNIAGAGPGGTVTFTLDAGDVVELAGPGLSTSEDLSGSLLHATQPVQVIGGHPCSTMPVTDPNATCDHLEASVFPAETLGQHYVVNVPTGPAGTPVAQIVRLYGNVDGTTLTYQPQPPSGCPSALDAGQVVECGAVDAAFEVTGSAAFGVGLFMQSAQYIDPGASASDQLGDPSMTFAVAVEQYRSRYIFLAPSDYVTNVADVVAPPGTTLTLDGLPVTTSPETIDGNFTVVRIPLAVGSTNGAHVLTGTAPFGIQVLGYAPFTSYQYPGGLNLQQIAPPPAQ